MNELIEQTVALVQKSSELLRQTETEEITKSAAKYFLDWLSNVFTKKSAKEKLNQIAENKVNQETILGLKVNLEYVLEDNDLLQKQLSEKIKELGVLLKNNGIQITRNNITSVTGNANMVFQNIMNSSNLTINRK